MKPKDFYRTPTTMDATTQDAFRYAARLLKGKSKRSSGEQVQVSLSHQVAMEILEDNPELIDEILKDEFTIRPNLPEKNRFVDWIRSVTSPKELKEKLDIKATTIDHWFRYDDYFSYPTINQWELLKTVLEPHQTHLFDYGMVHQVKNEWK